MANKTLKSQTKMRARLYVDQPLTPDIDLAFDADQSHYLRSVLRCEPGQVVLVFNGQDGEWRAVLTDVGKKQTIAKLVEQTRPQEAQDDVWLCFAPLKKCTTNFAVEKASELGAACIKPVLTRFTNSERVKIERLQAVAIEAAEQCERTTIPKVTDPVSLIDLLDSWPQERRLLVCAEVGDTRRPLLDELTTGPLAFLIGPEGGWSPEELNLFGSYDFIKPISLGKRILRAETAVAVAMGAYQLLLEANPKP